MKTVFEMVSQEALPLVRALTTKNLLANGLSQKKVADKLGLTQPAISQYKNELRGKRGIFSENQEAFEELRKISVRISSDEINIDQATMEVFEICRKVSGAK
jgi:predicted transcriptional regulator